MFLLLKENLEEFLRRCGGLTTDGSQVRDYGRGRGDIAEEIDRRNAAAGKIVVP
jgi:hypothetical protein